ncbi:MAG TPA: alkaline shock response membrane anchor protein AmaP [Thermoanaerobacterales bacterium]|nr:alkaline shock response membrane anchor protein AmaP [Thermoanaerobacterales bacterium]
MNFIDRILLTIFTLFSTIVSIIAILLAIRVVSLPYFSTSILTIYGRWETGAVGVVLLLISLKLLFSGIKPRKRPEAIITNGELGKVSITLNAIENLVFKVIRDTENIKDAKIRIKKYDESVSIILKLTIDFDVDIPNISLNLQNTLKDYINKTAGIIVKDVQITIDNVSNQTKQKAIK